MSVKKNTLQKLEKKAREDDISALFQLAQYYEEGRFVDQDKTRAQHYYDRLIEVFDPNISNISYIKLINFRLFESLEVHFDIKSKPLVFVGINGAGKTAILDAIAMSLSWLVKRILSPNGAGDMLKERDISNTAKDDYSSIISQLDIGGNYTFEVEISKAKQGSNASRKNQIVQLGIASDIFRCVMSKAGKVNLPILAYYSVKRALEIDSKEFEKRIRSLEEKTWNQFDGYDMALNGAADFQLFFSWYKYIDDVNNAHQSEKVDLLSALKELIIELNSGLYKDIETQSNDEVKEHLKKLKEGKEKEIASIQEKIASLDNEDEQGEAARASKILVAVEQAIQSFIPEFRNLRIQRVPFKDMLIEKNGEDLSVFQLSQGEKSLLALIADITRRMVLLNPTMKNPLGGKGIILIDEIDLHLHPEWQQKIVTSLTNVFPNVQFILTTHSPQVLSTLSRDSVRLLGVQNVAGNDIAAKPIGYTYGEPSNDILKSVMHVDPIPPVPEKDKLEYLTSLVEQGEYESDEAKAIFSELKNSLSATHPQLRKLERSIRRQEALKE